jgi:hypothetical protein
MRFDQRMFARLRYLELMTELYDTSFEMFFHSLMTAIYPDFLDTRTAGSLGDMGSDGLQLYEDALYACYAPQTFVAATVANKFTSDVQKAWDKRRGEFAKFVFVHNDRRGMHPQLVSLLAEAKKDYKELTFSQMGMRQIWYEIMKLNLQQVEELLHCPVPIEPVVYGVGMEELAPLLTHLKGHRQASTDPLPALDEVSGNKLDYNCLDSDSRRQLVEAMKYTPLVDDYYAKSVDGAEGEEVATGFTNYYQIVKTEWADAEDVLWQMEMYVLGNESQPPQVERCAWTILAYFFERCYIFEEPPPGWSRPAMGVQT